MDVTMHLVFILRLTIGNVYVCNRLLEVWNKEEKMEKKNQSLDYSTLSRTKGRHTP